MYQDMIRRVQRRGHGLSTVEPRIVEAWMRLEHGTLDSMSASEFAEEVLVSEECARHSTAAENESLARSYGL
jgi:hypothetical protein